MQIKVRQKPKKKKKSNNKKKKNGSKDFFVIKEKEWNRDIKIGRFLHKRHIDPLWQKATSYQREDMQCNNFFFNLIVQSH
jgi:hypothetical protein